MYSVWLTLLASAEVAEGAPTSPFDVNFGLFVWTWLVFGALFLVLRKYAWPAILSATEARERKIAGHLAETERLHGEAKAAAESAMKSAAEARASAQALLGTVTELRVEVDAFRDGFFPHEPALKERFEALKEEGSPDIILSPRREDLHQDHRTVAELAWQTFRDQPILEYEIPKFEGDLGTPNVFVELTRDICDRKVEHLLEQFPSQRDRRSFTADAFWALLRLRGLESNSTSDYAEAFTCRKVVV